jgi:hypothetical protein
MQRLQAERLAKLRTPRPRPPPSLWELEQRKVAGQPVEGPRLSAAEGAAHYALQRRAAGRAGEDVLFDWLAPTAFPALRLGELVAVARDRHKQSGNTTVRIRIRPTRRQRGAARGRGAKTREVGLEQWAAWVAAAGGEGHARFLGTMFGLGWHDLMVNR